MKIDYGLILCAGFGTRMGPIGKHLPKPLWPVFEKTLLELQIRFVKDLGAQKIFVNAHHQSDSLKKFLEEYNFKNDDDVELIFEPEILGTGGAVHNIACRDDIKYFGSFLYLASDQFYFFPPEYLAESLKQILDHPVSLLGTKIHSDSPYAHLKLENNFLREIEGPKEEAGITFSGMALVNLAKLKKTSGFSGFFESVCLYKEEEIPVVVPENAEYVDWGSAASYFSGMFELLQKRPKVFFDFCEKWGAFDFKKMNSPNNSYDLGLGPNLINLTSKEIENPGAEKAIVLREGIPKLSKAGLYFENIIHELPT